MNKSDKNSDKWQSWRDMQTHLVHMSEVSAKRNLGANGSGGDGSPIVVSEPVPELLIAGRYLIEKLLGKGGMGLVFQALDQKLGRNVVLKFIRPELAHQPEMVDQLMEEATAVARLNHPHVVTLHNCDVDQHGMFLIMEFVGPNLLQLLKDVGGTLKVEQAVRYTRHVGLALQAAHNAGIVHRDVKPSNVLINEAGVAKLADFGLARIHDGRVRTQGEDVPGTPEYAAPKSLTSGQSRDQWSLAATLYHLVTGNVPPRPVNLSRLPKSIRSVMERAFQDSEDRQFPSVEDFCAGLANTGQSLSHPSAISQSNESLNQDNQTKAKVTDEATKTRTRQSTSVEPFPSQAFPLNSPSHNHSIPELGLVFVSAPAHDVAPCTSPRKFSTTEYQHYLSRSTGSWHFDDNTFDLNRDYLELHEHPRCKPSAPDNVTIATTPVTLRAFSLFVTDTKYTPFRYGTGWTGTTITRGAAFAWDNIGCEYEACHPVTNVRLKDALAFCDWLHAIDPHHIYRLPYDHEWELFSRAGSISEFYDSDNPSELVHRANIHHMGHISWRLNDRRGTLHMFENLEHWSSPRFACA